MLNSKYLPASIKEYSRSDLNTNFQGSLFDVTPNTTTVFNYQIIDDQILDGIDLSVVGGINKGDYVIAQIVDVDGIYPHPLGGFMPAGTVLNTFSTKWVMVSGIIKQLSMESRYPAKIIHGLYIRISYVSTGALEAYVIANFKLHKVLW